HRPRHHRMAQHLAANRARSRSRMATLARPSGDGQRNSQRNRITHPDRSAATGISPDETRGPPPHFAPPLGSTPEFLGSETPATGLVRNLVVYATNVCAANRSRIRQHSSKSITQAAEPGWVNSAWPTKILQFPPSRSYLIEGD